MSTSFGVNAKTTAAHTASPRSAAPHPKPGSLSDGQKSAIVRDASAWLTEAGGAYVHQRAPVFQAIIAAVAVGRTETVVEGKPHDLPNFEGFTVINGGIVEQSQIELSHLQGKLLAKGREIADFEAQHVTATGIAEAILQQHSLVNAGRKPGNRSPLDLKPLDDDTKHLILLRQERAEILNALQAAKAENFALTALVQGGLA